MSTQVSRAVGCLGFLKWLYVLVSALVLAIGASGRIPDATGLWVIGIFCLALALWVRMTQVGLRERRFWAQVSAIILFGMCLFSAFLPLGIYGLVQVARRDLLQDSFA
jgi:amino acid transporter